MGIQEETGNCGFRDTADYEKSEEIAISDGKKVLQRATWLFNRSVDKAKGFFAELKETPINKDYYSVHCVDGVGTKLFFSAWGNDFSKSMIDGVAMNANDMAPLLRAYPSEISVYIACQTGVEEKHMGEIMNGLVDAAEDIRYEKAPYDMNVGKIETASLDEMISLGVTGKGADYGIVMNGFIKKEETPNLDPKPGDFIVGVSSTGMHSNGYTGARHKLLIPGVEPREEWKSQYTGKFQLDDKPEILQGKTVREAMQEPTALYLREANIIGDAFDSLDIYGINITGNGLHNFNRVGKGVVFNITDPLEPLPIHNLLMQESRWDVKTSFTKQNNGMGFAYIVRGQDRAELLTKIINNEGKNKAKIIGLVGVNPTGEEPITILHKNAYDNKVHQFVGYNG